MMDVSATPLPGVYRVDPRVFVDQQGFFMETWQAGRRTSAYGWPFRPGQPFSVHLRHVARPALPTGASPGQTRMGRAGRSLVMSR